MIYSLGGDWVGSYDSGEITIYDARNDYSMEELYIYRLDGEHYMTYTFNHIENPSSSFNVEIKNPESCN